MLQKGEDLVEEFTKNWPAESLFEDLVRKIQNPLNHLKNQVGRLTPCLPGKHISLLSGCQETSFKKIKLSDQPKSSSSLSESSFFVHHWSNGFTNGFHHWSKQNPGCRRMRLIQACFSSFVNVEDLSAFNILCCSSSNQSTNLPSLVFSCVVPARRRRGFHKSCSREMCQSVKSQVTSLESRISQGRTQFSIRRNISLFSKVFLFSLWPRRGRRNNLFSSTETFSSIWLWRRRRESSIKPRVFLDKPT